MRRAILITLLTTILTVSILRAEENEAADLPIATIDVAHIFKNYSPVAERLAPLKTAVKELETTLQLRQVEMDQLQRKLVGQPKEGEDRAKIQQQLAKLQTEVRQYVERERQGLQKRELDIQAEVYKEVQAEVRKIAKERGLKLVLVRPRGSLETKDAAELNRTLNQLVIFEEGLDITDEVLKALEAKENQDSPKEE